MVIDRLLRKRCSLIWGAVIGLLGAVIVGAPHGPINQWPLTNQQLRSGCVVYAAHDVKSSLQAGVWTSFTLGSLWMCVHNIVVVLVHGVDK